MGIGIDSRSVLPPSDSGKEGGFHNAHSKTSSADESPLADKWASQRTEEQATAVFTGNVVPFRPEAVSREREAPTLDLPSSGGDESTTEGPSVAERIAGAENMIRGWEFADDDSLVVLVERRGQCYAVAYYPPSISIDVPTIAQHFLVIGASVAEDAPPDLTVAGSIDQIILSGNAEELSTCSLEEIFEGPPAPSPTQELPEDDTGEDESAETENGLKKILPWAALAGALYVINEQF